MTLRGKSNNSLANTPSTTSSGSASSDSQKNDGLRHGSTESSDTVRGPFGVKINTAGNKKLQYVLSFIMLSLCWREWSWLVVLVVRHVTK